LQDLPLCKGKSRSIKNSLLKGTP